MAQKRTQQTRNTGRNQMNQDMDMSEDEQQTTSRAQGARSQRTQGEDSQTAGRATQRGQGGRQLAQRSGADDQAQSPVDQILSSVTPALQEARTYIEGSPVRAAAIGAIAGGLLMTLFSTEKGRQFAKMAYDYANPMVAKYAREYISQAAGNMTEQALSQH